MSTNSLLLSHVSYRPDGVLLQWPTLISTSNLLLRLVTIAWKTFSIGLSGAQVRFMVGGLDFLFLNSERPWEGPSLTVQSSHLARAGMLESPVVHLLRDTIAPITMFYAALATRALLDIRATKVFIVYANDIPDHTHHCTLAWTRVTNKDCYETVVTPALLARWYDLATDTLHKSLAHHLLPPTRYRTSGYVTV